MWKLNVVLHFVLLAMCATNVLCLSESEKAAMIEALTPITQQCLSECGVENFDPKQGPLDPCLKKCFLTKVKVIDDKGMLDPTQIHKLIMDYTENKDEAKKFIEQLDKCFEEKVDNATEGEEANKKRIDSVGECMHELHAYNQHAAS